MLLRALTGLLVVALVAAAAFLGFGRQILSNPDEPLQGSFGLVAVLAGPLDEDGDRVAAGAALARRTEECLLLLPLRHRALEWTWFVRHYRIEDPLPQERVILGRPAESPRVKGPGSGGTFAEARKTIAVMRERRVTSAVVVTSGYHIRRARLAFDRANTVPPLSFQFHAVGGDAEDGGLWWWLAPKALMRVVDEYLKLAAAYVIYR
jgi:uncharacterized SAM-binding protein YcdF (DUF218 family)